MKFERKKKFIFFDILIKKLINQLVSYFHIYYCIMYRNDKLETNSNNYDFN